MPTLSQAKKAWNHGRKGKEYYEAMTPEQKSAFWYYGRDNGFINRDSLDDYKRSEYDKYVFKNELQYAPNVSKKKSDTVPMLKPREDNYSSDMKVDKYSRYSGETVPLNKTYQFEDAKPAQTQKKPVLPPKLSTKDKKLMDYGGEKSPAVSKPTSKAKNLDKNKPKVVQQMKILPKGANKVENPFAAPVISALDSATLGMVSRNDKDIQDLYKRNPVSSTIGKIAGYATPASAGAKLAKPIVQKVGSELGKRVVEGALVGGGIQAAENVVQGKSLKQNAKETGAGILAGAAIDVSLGALGGAIRKASPQLFKKVQKAELLTKKEYDLINTVRKDLGINDDTFTRAVNSVDDKNMKDPLLNSIRKTVGITPSGKVDVKVTPKLPPLNQNTSNLTQNPPKANIALSAENKGASNTFTLPTPKKSNTSQIKERQFVANSALNSQVVPEQMKGTLSKNIPTYKPQSNQEQLNIATQKLSNGTAENEWQNIVSRGLRTGEDTALGEALIVDAIKKGDYTKATQYTVDLADKLTDAGRAVQAASILKRMSPEGMLTYAQRTINKANRELPKLSKKIELTEDDTKSIIEGMQKAQAMPDGREKDIEVAKVMKVLRDKIPSTLSEKIGTFQTISMLANPKTMVRNALGNALFATAENASNVVSAGLDKAISGITGERTTLLPDIGAQLRSGARGAKNTIEDYKLGIDTSNNNTQFDINRGKTFKGGVLGKLEDATGLGLKLGDTPFKQAAYDESLRQQMKIAGVTEPTADMIQQAEELGNYRTYQDNNKITELFTGIKNSFNKAGYKGFGLGDFVLKFPKTPANLLARAIDYSPLGAAKIITQAMEGSLDQKKLVDELGRIIVGSGVIGAGYAGNKAGILEGRANEDREAAAFDKMTGRTPYSLKLGDTRRTYDYLQPLSIPLAIGANVAGNKQAKTIGIDIAGSVADAANTLSEQSLLQGLQRALGSNTNRVSDTIATIASSAPASFTPTLLKQIAQLTDGTSRQTYDESELKANVTNPVLNRLPGAKNKLQPKIDTFGNEVKDFDGKNSWFNVLLNPGYTTKEKTSPAIELINRVYKATNDNRIFPRIVDKSYKKTDGSKLTAKEYADYQKTLGQLTDKELTKLAQDNPSVKLKEKQANGKYLTYNRRFEDYTPEQQAKIIYNILNDANDQAKEMLFK